MMREIESLKHWVTSVYTSGDTARSRYIETFYNWSIQIRSGRYRIVETYLHMNMAINV